LLGDRGFVDHRRLPRSCPVDIALPLEMFECKGCEGAVKAVIIPKVVRCSINRLLSAEDRLRLFYTRDETVAVYLLMEGSSEWTQMPVYACVYFM
jgi:hypothetical protein